MSNRLAGAILLSALSVSPAALAQVTGSITLGNLSYTLTDLDPDDGITPSLTFAPASPWSLIMAHYTGGETDIWESVGGYDNQPVELSYSNPDGGFFKMAVDGRHDGGNSLLELSAGTSAGDSWSSAGGWASSEGFGLELSPKTSVTFVFNVHTVGRIDGPVDTQSFSASAGISLYLEGRNGATHIDESRSYQLPDFEEGMSSIDILDLLTPTYANNTSGPMTGRLSFQGDLGLYSSIGSPVPEPSVASMLLGGLLLLGAQPARRRLAAWTKRGSTLLVRVIEVLHQPERDGVAI